jgi:hypothetical protein
LYFAISPISANVVDDAKAYADSEITALGSTLVDNNYPLAI